MDGYGYRISKMGRIKTDTDTKNSSLSDAALNRAALNRPALNRAALNRAVLNRPALNRAVLKRPALNRPALNHYARPQFDEHLIAGVKSMLAITVLFIPIVFFWALYDQQGSTWVLQARRMDGRIGWFTILPEQVNTLNPLLVLILVPLFEAWLYPTTNKMCKVTPLRKMAIGAILAAVAFCMAGFLQVKVNDTMEPQPEAGSSFCATFGQPHGPKNANESRCWAVPAGQKAN
uniref:Aa_trans domain-containing protein n=1 Tax=Globodera pallida TaxID=36090 RepID=A0A183CF24_GLOPA